MGLARGWDGIGVGLGWGGGDPHKKSNYSVVVFVTIVVLTALIAGLDYLTGEGVLRLFDVN